MATNDITLLCHVRDRLTICVYKSIHQIFFLILPFLFLQTETCFLYQTTISNMNLLISNTIFLTTILSHYGQTQLLHFLSLCSSDTASFEQLYEQDPLLSITASGLVSVTIAVSLGI